jgi:hypothetical protein
LTPANSHLSKTAKGGAPGPVTFVIITVIWSKPKQLQYRV